MHELLIRQLEEYAKEYELGTPTGDLFIDAARTIRKLCVQLNAVTDRLDAILANKESDADIFYRQQHKWDVEYVEDLAQWYDGDDEEYCSLFDRIESDQDFCSKVAFKYREYIEDSISGETEFDCLVDACKSIVRSEQRPAGGNHGK